MCCVPAIRTAGSATDLNHPSDKVSPRPYPESLTGCRQGPNYIQEHVWGPNGVLATCDSYSGMCITPFQTHYFYDLTVTLNSNTLSSGPDAKEFKRKDPQEFRIQGFPRTDT